MFIICNYCFYVKKWQNIKVQCKKWQNINYNVSSGKLSKCNVSGGKKSKKPINKLQTPSATLVSELGTPSTVVVFLEISMSTSIVLLRRLMLSIIFKGNYFYQFLVSILAFGSVGRKAGDRYAQKGRTLQLSCRINIHPYAHVSLSVYQRSQESCSTNCAGLSSLQQLTSMDRRMAKFTI